VTRESPAPGLYFIKQSIDYPQGCRESIRQTGSQRKKLLGTFDGKSVYSDDRDMGVPDHGYDPVRYFVAMHGTSPVEARKKPSRMSFKYYEMVSQLMKDKRISGSVQ